MRCVSCVAALLLTVADLLATPPALEDFVQPPAVSRLDLSPDGRHIAMIVPRERSADLVVLDRATLRPTANVKLRAGEYIDNYWWVRDDRLVVALAQKLDGHESPFLTGELWGVDADGGNNRYLFGYRGGDQAGSHIKAGKSYNGAAFVLEGRVDGNDKILVALQPFGDTATRNHLQLARMSVRTGALTMAGKAPVAYFNSALSDHAAHVRWIAGSDADRLQKLYYRSSVDAEWTLYNDGKHGRIITPLAYAADGVHIYARVDDGKGPESFVRLNPENGEEKVLMRGKQASPGGVVLTADQRDVFALRTHEGRGGWAFVKRDSPEAVLTQNVMQSFPGELAIANSFSLDGAYATVFVTSDVNPGEYFLWDQQAGALQSLVRARPKLKSEVLAPMEPFQFQTRDGLELQALVTRPAGISTALPMVVLPHGGPFGIVDRWGFDLEAQVLASRGYAVLQVNFRGSGGRGKAFETAGYREWGGKMQHDLTDATRWAIEQGIADADRICLVGTSYGAYAAVMGLVLEPDLYRCAVGVAGVYDLPLLRTHGDVRRSGLGRDYLDEVLAADDAWLAERSPAQRAGEIVDPVLLIHGGRDERAPIAHAESLRKALQAAGNPPGWLVEPTEGHGYYKPEHQLRAWREILEFLAQHTAQAAEASSATAAKD